MFKKFSYIHNLHCICTQNYLIVPIPVLSNYNYYTLSIIVCFLFNGGTCVVHVTSSSLLKGLVSVTLCVPFSNVSR